MSDILRDIEGINFKGFPPLLWDRIFKREAIMYECGMKRNLFRQCIKLIIYPFIHKAKTFSYRPSSNSKILFFQDIDREICKKQFENVTKLLISADVLISDEKYIIQCHFFQGFRTIMFIGSWIKELMKYHLRFSQKVDILVLLLLIYNFHQSIRFLNIEKFHLFVSFYDSLLYDAYLTELFKYYNIPTATLQHGAFSAWRENELIHSGVELRTFHSDYLLCWNQFTVSEAIKSGINPSSLVVTGVIGYVGEKYRKCISPKNKYFGIVIGHPSFHQENIALIQAANLLARNTGYKYYLKLHPNYKEDAFSVYVDNEFYIGNIKKGILMIDYAEMVEFSIVYGSSVFIELIYLGHDVIRYSDGGIHDKYRDIHIGKIFSRIDDIVKVYKQNLGKDYSNDLFNMMCTIRDVDKSYKEFFMKFE